MIIACSKRLAIPKHYSDSEYSLKFSDSEDFQMNRKSIPLQSIIIQK